MQNLEDLYEIRNRNGTFIDEYALGYSARVVRAMSFRTGQDTAFKILRRERINEVDVWPRFVTEVRILTALNKNRVAVRMFDCGFVSDHVNEFPISGHIQSCDLDVDQFISQLPGYREQGWRPYIALELIPLAHNLLKLIRGADGNGTHALRLPTEEGLTLAIQFSDFLQEMHSKNMVYIDHKPEHAYWDGKQLRVIDFNVSQIFKENISAPESASLVRKDMANFVKGVLYTSFTGLDFRYQSQGLAPSARPSDPTNVDKTFGQVNHLDFGMQETLLPQLAALINRAADSSSNMTATEFTDELKKCAAAMGHGRPGYPVTKDATQSREETLKGLAALRDAQNKLEQARDHFLTARELCPEIEENRRLYKATSEFYNHRVLP